MHHHLLPDINFTLDNSLFGSVKLTKNADLDKYKYNGYNIGFDSRSEFLFADGSFGKNFNIFRGIWAQLCILIIRQTIS